MERTAKVTSRHRQAEKVANKTPCCQFCQTPCTVQTVTMPCSVKDSLVDDTACFVWSCPICSMSVSSCFARVWQPVVFETSRLAMHSLAFEIGMAAWLGSQWQLGHAASSFQAVVPAASLVSSSWRPWCVSVRSMHSQINAWYRSIGLPQPKGCSSFVNLWPFQSIAKRSKGRKSPHAVRNFPASSHDRSVLCVYDPESSAWYPLPDSIAWISLMNSKVAMILHASPCWFMVLKAAFACETHGECSEDAEAPWCLKLAGSTCLISGVVQHQALIEGRVSTCLHKAGRVNRVHICWKAWKSSQKRRSLDVHLPIFTPFSLAAPKCTPARVDQDVWLSPRYLWQHPCLASDSRVWGHLGFGSLDPLRWFWSPPWESFNSEKWKLHVELRCVSSVICWSLWWDISRMEGPDSHDQKMPEVTFEMPLDAARVGFLPAIYKEFKRQSNLHLQGCSTDVFEVESLCSWPFLAGRCRCLMEMPLFDGLRNVNLNINCTNVWNLLISTLLSHPSAPKAESVRSLLVKKNWGSSWRRSCYQHRWHCIKDV